MILFCFEAMPESEVYLRVLHRRVHYHFPGKQNIVGVLNTFDSPPSLKGEVTEVLLSFFSSTLCVSEMSSPRSLCLHFILNYLPLFPQVLRLFMLVAAILASRCRSLPTTKSVQRIFIFAKICGRIYEKFKTIMLQVAATECTTNMRRLCERS